MTETTGMTERYLSYPFLPPISLGDWLGSGTIRPTSALDSKMALVNDLRAPGMERR